MKLRPLLPGENKTGNANEFSPFQFAGKSLACDERPDASGLPVSQGWLTLASPGGVEVQSIAICSRVVDSARPALRIERHKNRGSSKMIVHDVMVRHHSEWISAKLALPPHAQNFVFVALSLRVRNFDALRRIQAQSGLDLSILRHRIAIRHKYQRTDRKHNSKTFHNCSSFAQFSPQLIFMLQIKIDLSHVLHSSLSTDSPCFRAASNRKSLKTDLHALIPDEKYAKIVCKSAE